MGNAMFPQPDGTFVVIGSFNEYGFTTTDRGYAHIDRNGSPATPPSAWATTNVPADTRFELQLVNLGKTPAEFESVPLRKEKVIGPGVTTSMVIKYLEPGEYSFFDDFHPEAPPAVLIAK